MYKFDLQRALAGEPLITRGGLPAGNFRENKQKNRWHPYLADVGDGDFWFYEANGTAPGAGYGDELDLFMLHETSGAGAAQSATEDRSTGAAFPFEWQPIETAPRDAKHILVWGKDIERGADFTVAYYDEGSWNLSVNLCCGPVGEPLEYANNQPTHWMTLPAPPTE